MTNAIREGLGQGSALAAVVVMIAITARYLDKLRPKPKSHPGPAYSPHFAIDGDGLAQLLPMPGDTQTRHLRIVQPPYDWANER